ncbi:unnamed protein product [Kuraishia capsulata CBS 1993]|uniref:PH domain-containing protein n=1 Tax=Kuraishia capsulata CBS 1993 TaxID=1382522 RepID=W6MLI7_9ASCO|nr:uncharacterized protein KUCA_T00001657001 [Kuraishia capsulata CBS 1993]CDK25687.1 unnamed protein product [Kuraishia capsulata CBS 1993]
MTVETISRQVNHEIKNFIVENPRAKLEEDAAIEYVSSLKESIARSDFAEAVNCTIILARVLELSPPSDKFVELLDRTFFKKIWAMFTSKSVSDEFLRMVLRISLLFLSGSMFTTRVGASFNALLAEIHNNRLVLELLTSTLDSSDIRLSSAVIDFISKILFRASEQSKSDFLLFSYKNLEICGFFEKCIAMAEDVKYEQALAGYFKDCISSISMAVGKLRVMRFDQESSSAEAIVSELVEELDSALYSTGRSLKKQDLSKIDFSENPQAYIKANFSGLSAIQLLVFLEDRTITFKKLYHDHLIFANRDEYFPVNELALSVSSILDGITQKHGSSDLQSRLNSTKDIYRILMVQALNFWKASKASRSDVEVIVTLLKCLLEYTEVMISIEDISLSEAMNKMGDLSYEKLRTFQLEKIKKERDLIWKKPMEPFSNHLRDQVFEFVKEQHFLQLSKGSWVYAEDPTQAAPNNPPKRFFMILSPNTQSIIYKKFDSALGTRPNIDEDGLIFDISQICGITSTTLQSNNSVPGNSRLISLSGKNVYERIILYNRQKKPLFSFYTDTKDVSYAWSDGLKMLAKTDDDYSLDTRKQMQALERIRGGVQLLNLEGHEAQYSDPPVFQTETLASIATGFYYN